MKSPGCRRSSLVRFSMEHLFSTQHNAAKVTDAISGVGSHHAIEDVVETSLRHSGACGPLPGMGNVLGDSCVQAR
jgi:hypothetical protein